MRVDTNQPIFRILPEGGGCLSGRKAPQNRQREVKTVVGATLNTDERSIEFTVRVWYDPAAALIHVAGPEGLGVDGVVSDHPASLCFHPELYQQLRRLLSKHGCWPG